MVPNVSVDIILQKENWINCQGINSNAGTESLSHMETNETEVEIR